MHTHPIAYFNTVSMLLSVYAFITTCLNQYILLVLGLEFCTREWCTPLHRNYPKYVATYYYREQTFDLFHILYQGQHWSVQQKKTWLLPITMTYSIRRATSTCPIPRLFLSPSSPSASRGCPHCHWPLESDIVSVYKSVNRRIL